MSIPPIAPYAMPVAEALPENRVQWPLNRDRAVLLVHDMQNYFVNFYDKASEPYTSLIANIQQLISFCRSHNIPVIYTAQPGDQKPEDRALLTDFWGTGLADDPALTGIVADIAPQPQDHQLTKWRYSAFKRTGLRELLAEQGRDQMIVCGVYAHIGCLLSCADAFMYDVQSILVADAVADFSQAEHEMALKYAAGRCARVAMTGELVSAPAVSGAAVKNDSAIPSSRAELKNLIAEQAGLEADDFLDDDDLVEIGLDSIRVMLLLETWRKAGAELTLTELAENPTVAHWWTLLEPQPEVA